MAQRGIDFGGVHARHQEPGRIGDGAHVAKCGDTAVVHALHDTGLSQYGFHRQHLGIFQWEAQAEGRVLLEPEFIQKQDVVPIPADEQGLGSAAGGGPLLDERIEIDLRVDPQDHHAQRAAALSLCIDGRQEREVNGAVRRIPVEIHKGHLSQPQGGDGLPGQVSADRFGGAWGGQPLHAWVSSRKTRS